MRMPVTVLASYSKMSPAGSLMKCRKSLSIEALQVAVYATRGGSTNNWNKTAFERMNSGSREEKSKPAYLIPTRPQTKRTYPYGRLCCQRYQPVTTRAKKWSTKKFGFGEVLKMEGAAHNPIATVKFELNGGEKDHVELCEAEDTGVKKSLRYL
jgi:hypothetical protein